MSCCGHHFWPTGPVVAGEVHHHGHGVEAPPGAPVAPDRPAHSQDPLVILKRRLATGEITVEEYEKLRTVLQS